MTSFPALSLASHAIFPSSLPLPALFVYRVFPPLCPLMSHRAGLSRSLRRRSQTSSCLRGFASIAESESAWLRFHSFIQKEKKKEESRTRHVSHIVRHVATGTGGFVLQLVFKGRALLHLRSAAFDVHSGRYKHLFCFFCFFPCSAPCDLFANRPQCSPLRRGFHANAAGGETKSQEGSVGQRDRSLTFVA